MAQKFLKLFLLIDDNTGPVSCEEKGLIMQRFPDYTRKPTQANHTFPCVSNLLPEQYFWYKNGIVSYIQIVKDDRNYR